MHRGGGGGGRGGSAGRRAAAAAAAAAFSSCARRNRSSLCPPLAMLPPPPSPPPSPTRAPAIDAARPLDHDGGGDPSWTHHRHHDGLDHRRWTARECHRYLENRPWAAVLEFYSLLSAGKRSLQDLKFHGRFQHAASQARCTQHQSPTTPWISEDSVKEYKEFKGGKWDRKTYKIVLAYDGSSFAGWQRQTALYTVQGVLEQALGQFCDGKKVASLKSRGISAEAVVTVAGRTDKGVHAAGQVCSFYTWRSDIESEDIKTLINSLEPKSLMAISVDEVFRTFHPNFSACWRRYVYILPLSEMEIKKGTPVTLSEMESDIKSNVLAKPEVFDVVAVNEMLKKLEGKQLSYAVFARDTKSARSSGPPTECILHHARAAIAELPSMESGSEKMRKVMCVELVGNRFLRKMVRVLVATSIREAAAGAPHDILVRLTGTSCRRASAPPAPPCGLCLAEVSYREFSGADEGLLIDRSMT